MDSCSTTPFASSSSSSTFESQTQQTGSTLYNNLENVDISNLRIVEKTSQYVKTHFQQYDRKDLKILDLRLEREITLVKNDTAGLFNWFKYFVTFRRSQRNAKLSQVSEMQSLREKIAQAIRDNNFFKGSSGSQPLQGGDNLSPPPAPGGPDAPPLAPELSGAPIAPLFELKKTGSAKIILPTEVKQFVKEPTQPANINASATPLQLKAVSKEGLEKEIAVIRPFIEEFSKALAPIREAIANEIKLIEKAQQLKKAEEEFDRQFEHAKYVLEGLSNNQPFSLAQLDKKGEQIVKTMPVTFYSDEEFEKINEARAKIGKTPLSDNFKRSKQITIATAKRDAAKKDKERAIAEQEQVDLDLKDLRKQENNGVPFQEYKDVLEERQKVLSKWTSALNLRLKKLEPVTASPVGGNNVAAPVQPHDELDANRDVAYLFKGNNDAYFDKLLVEEK